MTDMFHLKAIEIIADSLHGAVQNTPAGWEGMALGIVHSMVHSLGAVDNTLHEVGNANLPRGIMKYNAPKPVKGKRVLPGL